MSGLLPGTLIVNGQGQQGIPVKAFSHAAFILGLLIAGWHLPSIVVGQVSWTDMIQIMGAVIIFNWLFNNARGSVLIIMLAHAVNNTVWSTPSPPRSSRNPTFLGRPCCKRSL